MSRNVTTPHFRAVLFDLDGVIADTREWVVSAYRHTAHVHGIPADEARLHALFGQPLETCYEAIAPEADHRELVRTHRTYQRANLHLIRPFDGIRPVIEALAAAGIRLGIVTGRQHWTAEETLDLVGLRALFPMVVGCDDTPCHKPHPEPVLAALAQLGARPSDAAMVGDAPVDIRAGAAAGCVTIGALYGFIGEALLESRPDHAVRTPGEILQIAGVSTIGNP